MSDDQQFDEILEKSRDADLKVLIAAKTRAQQATAQKPTEANLRTLARANKMLDAAMQGKKQSLEDVAAVLGFVADAGRKLAKSKLYKDVNEGRLRRQADGTFLVKHVEKYMLSLPMAGNSEEFVDDVEKRQKRMDDAKIRRAEADAEAAEFNLDRMKGLYAKRDEVMVELAGRAVALREGLKSAFESAMPELVDAVDGDALKVPALRAVIERIVDTSMGEYAKPMIFEVEIGGFEEFGGDEE